LINTAIKYIKAQDYMSCELSYVDRDSV